MLKTEQFSQGPSELISALSSTLDEGLFFKRLSSFLAESLGITATRVYGVWEESITLLDMDGPWGQAPSLGPAKHVARIKRPYFSNNPQRDPLFAGQGQSSELVAELCVPVVVDNTVMATLHFGHFDQGKKFGRSDIQKVLEAMAGIGGPLLNLKMYVATKRLNESLLKKVELANRPQALHQDTAPSELPEKKFLGSCPQLVKVKSLMEKVAKTKANALIIGEKGSGKELLAKSICSLAPGQAFLSVDCSALSQQALNEKLFGLEMIGPNGESIIREGLVEKARGGVVFIKNVEQMSHDLQAKLALFLDQGQAFRVNGERPFSSEKVRVLASSSQIETSGMAHDGKLREDLFYAINTVLLELPPLRDRGDDIELLANFFLNDGKGPKEQKFFSPKATRILREYSWPGNVRELQSVVERSGILAEGNIIEEKHVDGLAIKEVNESDSSGQDQDFEEMTLYEIERQYICRALDHLRGNKTKTAKMLGITIKTLYNKLHNYGMIAGSARDQQQHLQ